MGAPLSLPRWPSRPARYSDLYCRRFLLRFCLDRCLVVRSRVVLEVLRKLLLLLLLLGMKLLVLPLLLLLVGVVVGTKLL